MPPRFSLLDGFAAGFSAMLTFHQPLVAVLARFGLYPAEAYVVSLGWMGLPQVLQGAIWSGGWGVLFLLLHRVLAPAAPLLLAAPLYCATVPIGFLFLVMSPWAGAGIAWGLSPGIAALVVATHLGWGVGIAVWLHGMRGARSEFSAAPR
jgi:hypothetical protein